MTSESPPAVGALYAGVTRLLDLSDPLGRKVGKCTSGVYMFIDYDDEPIYVGQTTEKLRVRIRRHLTNQRTDAVAIHLDMYRRSARMPVGVQRTAAIGARHPRRRAQPATRASHRRGRPMVERSVA